MVTVAVVLVVALVLVLVALDIRRNGHWDPWADFDAATGGDDGLSALDR